MCHSIKGNLIFSWNSHYFGCLKVNVENFFFSTMFRYLSYLFIGSRIHYQLYHSYLPFHYVKKVVAQNVMNMSQKVFDNRPIKVK